MATGKNYVRGVRDSRVSYGVNANVSVVLVNKSTPEELISLGKKGKDRAAPTRTAVAVAGILVDRRRSLIAVVAAVLFYSIVAIPIPILEVVVLFLVRSLRGYGYGYAGCSNR